MAVEKQDAGNILAAGVERSEVLAEVSDARISVAKIAIMAITISNSMSVKAPRRRESPSLSVA